MASPDTPRTLEQLPAEVRTLIEAFLRYSHGPALHPVEMYELIQLVRYCHDQRVSLSEGELCAILQQGGFTDTEAKHYASIYAGTRMLFGDAL
jgi:hypothetical protein